MAGCDSPGETALDDGRAMLYNGVPADAVTACGAEPAGAAALSAASGATPGSPDAGRACGTGSSSSRPGKEALTRTAHARDRRSSPARARHETLAWLSAGAFCQAPAPAVLAAAAAALACASFCLASSLGGTSISLTHCRSADSKWKPPIA